MPSCLPEAIVFDFDGTITSKDTITTLFEQAIAFQPSDFQPSYNEIISKYNEDFSRHNRIYKPSKETITALDEKIAFYRSLESVELKSFSRVSTSGIFKGISSEEWYRIGQRVVEADDVKIRNGFVEIINHAKQQRTKVGVVSVNFSCDFIRGVLRSSAPRIEIKANRIDERGIIFGPGGEGKVMATSDRKLSAMHTLLDEWDFENKNSRIIYVGDSGMDIECLTTKGVTGIVVAEDGANSLIDTLRRVGITVSHLSKWSDTKNNIVYWAKDFMEIRDILYQVEQQS